MSSATSPTVEKWDVIIKPQQAWWRLDLKEFWHYRDLIALMVRRDVTAQYKQTLLGPLWHVVQPLLTTITFAFVFGRAAGLAPPDVPPLLFYMSGIVTWNFFAGVVTRTSKTFTGNANLMSKVYFPRLVVPVATTVSSLVSYAIQLATLLVFIAYFFFFRPEVHLELGERLLLLPLLVVLMAALGLGTGIFVSSLTTRFRDLGFLVGFGVQLLMYASPVILPLSRLEKIPWLLKIFQLNPMTPVIEAARVMLFGGTVQPGGLLYTAAFAVVMLALGLAVFHRVERDFSDTI